MYKLSLLTLLSISYCWNLVAQCPSGDIILSSQEDVTEFATNYPNCSEITKSLSIRSIEFSPSNISDLSGLDGLTSIEGNLKIERNGPLSSLTGLENISSVGGNLQIIGNISLTTLTDLSSLSELGGYIDISNNEALSTLQGLEGLNSVNGFLSVFDNNGLENLQGLENIITIGGELYIGSNDVLSGLGELSNLTSIGGRLALIYTVLTSLEGLENLVSINGELTLVDNFTLTNLEGLEQINSNTITNVRLTNNPQLSVCSIENICDYLGIDMNTAEISENATGCGSREAILETCSPTKAVGNRPVLQLDIFPNPTTGLIQLLNINTEQLYLFNTQGQRLAAVQLADQELDLSHFPPGNYYL